MASYVLNQHLDVLQLVPGRRENSSENQVPLGIPKSLPFL